MCVFRNGKGEGGRGGYSSYHLAITASLIGGATERNMEGMSEHQEMSAAFLTGFLRKCDMVH